MLYNEFMQKIQKTLLLINSKQSSNKFLLQRNLFSVSYISSKGGKTKP